MPALNHEGSGNNTELSDLYDHALPEVYRYLRSRSGTTELAEELTSSTFVQAALALSSPNPPTLSVGWLITVARNKLIDHWRRDALAKRSMSLIEGEINAELDPWNVVLDQARANEVLTSLDPHYRSVLVLRYLDDLSVKDCAAQLNRSVRSTESLLVRARASFRKAYEATGDRND